MWWTCHHQVSVILTIFVLLVWYSSFWYSSFSFSLSLWFSSNVHVLVGLLSHECWLLLSFSYYGFFSDPRCCPISSRYMCLPYCLPFGFFFTDDHRVDWSSCNSTHREKFIVYKHIYINIYIYIVLTFQHPFMTII